LECGGSPPPFSAAHTTWADLLGFFVPTAATLKRNRFDLHHMWAHGFSHAGVRNIIAFA
jgi:hypothetical protein